MVDYLVWNNALAGRFFRPDRCGRPVYLFVTDDLVGSVARALGTDDADLVAAVSLGPPWSDHGGFCDKALQSWWRWRQRPALQYPPYLAYLAVCVLAAGIDGDFQPNSYYPRLRRLLGMPFGSTLPRFEMMHALWRDLESWTSELDGNLGVFRAQSVGGMRHIGYPLSQTILTERERASLPAAFAASSLDPTAPPPRGDLARRVAANASDHLRPRTLNLLLAGPDTELRAALIDALYEELADWTGTADEVEPAAPGNRQAPVHSGLRLCLSFDPVACRGEASLRARLFNRSFPDAETLCLSGAAHTECSEAFGGWSTPIQLADGRGHFVPTGRQLLSGLTLRERGVGWQLRLPAGPIRILVPGASESLPGLVEVFALPTSGPVYLLTTSSDAAEIRPWLTTCPAYREYPSVEGFPDDWSFFYIGAALEPPPRLTARYPILAPCSQVRLRFMGGIQVGDGTSYFAFAPPDVIAEGTAGEITATCGDRPLPLRQDGLGFTLPADLPRDERLWVELRTPGTTRRRPLVLAGALAWRFRQAENWRDGFGELADNAPSYSGLVTRLPGADDHVASEFAWPLPVAVTSPRWRGHLVGRYPGQVHELPALSLPDWPPVWAVPSRKGAEVVYCGHNPPADSPAGVAESPSEGPPRRRLVHHWRDVLWLKRKRVVAPQSPALKQLWRRYLEAASHA